MNTWPLGVPHAAARSLSLYVYVYVCIYIYIYIDTYLYRRDLNRNRWIQSPEC